MYKLKGYDYVCVIINFSWVLSYMQNLVFNLQLINDEFIDEFIYLLKFWQNLFLI